MAIDSHSMWGQLFYQILAVMQLKWLNGHLQVEVEYSQLLTMASETVHPIDCPLLPTPYMTVPLSATYAMQMCTTNKKSSKWYANPWPSEH